MFPNMSILVCIIRNMSSTAVQQTKDTFGKLFEFLIKNSFSFTVGVMCFVHAGLLLFMGITGVMPLFFFNILSVVVYIFCFILCRFRLIMPAYVSIILEVTIYTVISTYYVGLKCGTYCFLFSIIPIIIYFGSYLFKGSKRLSIAIMPLLNFVVFIALYLRFGNSEPIYDLAPAARLFLVFYSAFAMVFSVIFYNAMYIYMSEHEVTNLEQKNRQLSTDAQEDALTSLLNRRGFLPLVDELMKDEGSSKFCVAFCDIDNFKHVNDSYGHEAGDEVLKHITLLIRKEMNGSEVCRWGGEEIVILMKDSDIEQARERMEHLRKSVEVTPTLFFNKVLYVTITIGVAQNNEIYKDPEDVIKTADRRMYYGKQHGKNVVVYEDNKD